MTLSRFFRLSLATLSLLGFVSQATITDESLLFRAEKAAEKVSNPVRRQATVRIIVQKVVGIDQEKVCDQSGNVAVVDEQLDETLTLPLNVTCQTRIDNRPATVLLKVQVRLAKKQSLPIASEKALKVVSVQLNVVRPEQLDLISTFDATEPVRKNLADFNIVYSDVQTPLLVVPVGLHALFLNNMDDESIIATVEIKDPQAK